MEIRPRGAFGNSEHLADLAVGEAFYIVEDDHRALPVSELRQRLGEAATKLVRFSRVSEGKGNGFRQLISIANFSASYEVERGVGHDTVEPCSERLIRTEAVQRPICVKKSFLDCVFRVFVREHDGTADRVGSPLMQVHEGREGIAIPALRRHHQRALVRVPARRARLKWRHRDGGVESNRSGHPKRQGS